MQAIDGGSCVKVFVNDAETLFVSAAVDRCKQTYFYQYSVKPTTLYAAHAIKILLNTNNRRLQAVFKCRQRTVCIVNACQKSNIKFDGFINAHDESHTDAFVVTYLNALRPDHGLRVRDMARAMESPTVIQIFVNEAVFTNENHTDCAFLANGDHDRHTRQLLNMIGFDDDDDDDDDNEMERIESQSPRLNAINKTQWAPVACNTGSHLFTINLKFTFTQ